MAATMTMDGLLDRYETNKLKNKNVEKILEQIVSHKEVVSYIIEWWDKYLTLALEEAQNILKDSKDKLEVLIWLDRLLKIYFESSVNKISTENCQKVREIYVDLKDSEYKIPKKQLETIRS